NPRGPGPFPLAAPMATLHATIDNTSLTLSAVGSGGTERAVAGGEDVVCAKEIIQCPGCPGAATLPTGEGSSARPLHAAGPARIPLPDHQYVAGWIGPAGTRDRQ